MTITKLVGITGLVLVAASAQEGPAHRTTAENLPAFAATMGMMPCYGQGDGIDIHQCQLRETARLFLVAGERKIALRILCAANPAIEVFRPQGALAQGKYEDNIAANRRCLEAVGLE